VVFRLEASTWRRYLCGRHGTSCGILFVMITKTHKIFVTFFFFFLAGLFEIGGGYLVWLWLREDYVIWIGLLGGIVLFLYGVVQTFQISHFHRVYAAYGGVFIVMAMLWGWIFDGIHPDMYDVIGGLIALVGAAVIFYWPRKHESVWNS
jgi:small multidrug resistance family-3 protein